MTLLTVNVGSSSLKLHIYAAGTCRQRLQADGIAKQRAILSIDGEQEEHPALDDHQAALAALLPRIRDHDHIESIIHRVVHGGARREPAWLDDGLRAELAALVPLAPSHQPAAVSMMDACQRVLPGVPQAVAFDTWFHASMPDLARRYAVPEAWRAKGIERFGFHGLAYADVVDQLGPELRRRAVLLQLGSGCSAAAVFDGASRDTSMGMTPLEGLVMATRCGDIDPGAVLALQRIHGLDLEAVDRLLNHESGLLGMSGTTMTMHDFVHQGEDPQISAAMDLFAYRAAKTIASYGVALGGIEQIVFSGGVGEHAPDLRRRILDRLGWLGVRYDPQANAENQHRLSAAGAGVDLRIVPVDESRQLARILVGLMPERRNG